MKNNQKGNVLPAILAILVIAFGVWVFFYVRDHRNDQGSSSTAAKTSSSTNTASTPSTQLSSGTDNQSLNSDLQNVNSGLSQGSQQLQSSNGALNDQQLPVTE